MIKKLAKIIEEGNISSLRKIIRKNLNPKKSVLDVGCGSNLSFDYSREFSKVVAVETNLKHIQNLKAKKLGIKIIKADATKLPFPRNSFCQVILSGVIQYVKNYDEVLNECSRVLKPKGTFLLSTINKNSLLRRIGVISKKPKIHAGEHKIFSIKEIKELLIKNEFTIESFKGSDFGNVKIPSNLCANMFFRAKR